MAFIAAGSVILIWLATVFLFLVLPIIVIYKYIKTDAFERPSVLWVIAICVLGPIPAFIYSIKYLESKFLKACSWIGVALMFSILVFGLIFVSYFNKEFKKNSNSVKIAVSNSKNTDQLEDADFLAIYDNVDTLAAEFKNTSWLSGQEKKFNAIELITTLGKFMDDQNLTRAEYEQWKIIFAARSVRALDNLNKAHEH